MTPASKARSRRPVTLTAIAQHLELSVATVSYVLNGKVEENKIPEKTAERVRTAARELGYVPNEMARSLRRQRTGAVGILFSDLQSSWAHRAVTGMMRVFDEGDFIPYISVHFWDAAREERELMSLLGRRVEAIITTPLAANAHAYRIAESRGVPIVFLQDSIEACPEISYVMWDAKEAAKASVRHLASIGRKRIGFVGVQQNTPFVLRRLAGYREGMKEAGLEVNEDWILMDPFIPVLAPQDIHTGYGQSVERLFKGPKPWPDALLAMNDSVAGTTLGVTHYELGIDVPGEVAVMGMGNLPESHWMGLSSSVEPIEDIGEAAARAVVALAREHKPGPIHHLVPNAEILPRFSTTGAPKP